MVENTSKTGPGMKLRTVDDLIAAHEWLFERQRSGQIDAKSADSLNTTLKGQVYLVGRLRLDALKVLMTSRIKKLEIPMGMLPISLDGH